jgi:hypothetical protein
MIVVAAHRHLAADVSQQLGGYAGIFGKDPIGPPKGVGGALSKIAQIANRGCHDVEAGSEVFSHSLTAKKFFQIKCKRVIIGTFIVCLGRGSMIVLLVASSITLTALQASINAPRDAFKTCLKDASSKALSAKVTAEGYEAYVRTACTNELGGFKTATVKFDMGNKMSRKDASEDADSMISDFVASALDHYKYMAGSSLPQKLPATPPPTPAAEPKN